MPNSSQSRGGDDVSFSARRSIATTLLRQHIRLWPRFLAIYTRLSRLPRGWRRRLSRKAAVSLSGAALLLALGRAPTARAAPITVANGEVEINNNNRCSLREAIINANDNARTYVDCAAGDGADTIILPAGGLFSLADAFVDYDGNTALPLITSEITIEGNGATMQRDSAAVTDFRLLAISGHLTINDLTMEDFSTSDDGGVLFNKGRLDINDSTFSDNKTTEGGGAIHNDNVLQISDSTFSGNRARIGGAVRADGTSTTISNSIFNKNEAYFAGGAVVNLDELTISNSTFHKNEAASAGGAISNRGEMTLYNSTFSENEATYFGGAIYNFIELTVHNSTFSGNSAEFGGGIYNDRQVLTVYNSTFSGNSAVYGGGLYNHGRFYLERTLVSGNQATRAGDEIMSRYPWTSGGYNLIGHDAISYVDALLSFVPVDSDIIATDDGTHPTPLDNILQTTLAPNEGSTAGPPGLEQPVLTFALVSGSPAIDAIPSATCYGPPVNGLDQRGFLRNVDGRNDGNPEDKECDIGAFEFNSFRPQDVFMTAAGPGATTDGINFGKEDILHWDGDVWSKPFDGVDAGLTTKHDINAIHVNAADDLYLSFFQNKIKTANLGKVFGHDIIHYDGSSFSLFFDGSDVGLTTVGEKVDALHVLDGSASPIGSGCDYYLLVSTLGTGKVPAFGGGNIKFQGEDILGFCMTNTGDNTAGFWHMVLDGSAEGMPKNSTDSISATADGESIYLTTKATFNLDNASGGHSMVYEYDLSPGRFSGPHFRAPANGLSQKVDGLHVVGSLP